LKSSLLKFSASVNNSRKGDSTPLSTSGGKPMAFSQIELKRIERTVGELCHRRSPAHLRDRLRLEYAVKGHEVVIYENRPRWNNPRERMESPVAKLKFVSSANKWRLYWQRADLKWHEYPGSSTSEDIADLVREIDADPLACFFG
jgi:hypothetical protein